MHKLPRERKNRLTAKPNYLNLTSGANLQLSGVQLREKRGQRKHCLKYLTDLTKEKQNLQKIHHYPMLKEASVICIHSMHTFHFFWNTQIFTHSINTCMFFSCKQTGFIQYHSSTPSVPKTVRTQLQANRGTCTITPCGTATLDWWKL